MLRPTVNGNYTKEELEKYARYRKSKEIEIMHVIVSDQKVIQGEISVEEHEEYCEPLAITEIAIVDIQLSTGGDADGFKLTFNLDKELISGVYYWADWGVYEEVVLSKRELELVDDFYRVTNWFTGY